MTLPRSALLVALLAGCGGAAPAALTDAGAVDVDYGPTVDPRCRLVADRCHAWAESPGTGHDCHQLAHANNVAMCVSRMAECLAACPPPDAAAPADGP